MLHDFLLENRDEILDLTEAKSLDLTGVRPTSAQLKKGLPLFYDQLINVLKQRREAITYPNIDKVSMIKAAAAADEQALTRAAGRPDEMEVTKSAGEHGAELLRLGYSLSHVVHAYGAMCQSITELASVKKEPVTAREFHDLNRCLDIAIAGAVTEFQSHRNLEIQSREVQSLGFLAHELRNSLNSVNISYQMIKQGSVGHEGSTGKVLERSLKRMESLIDCSLTEVRLRIDPTVHVESGPLLNVINQILITAEVEANAKNQTLDVNIDPALNIEADRQLLYSALSNVIQNAIKYTPAGGGIQIRAAISDDSIVIEVEDSCGGLSKTGIDLFKPFEQQHDNRSGLGLGLTIAKRAVELNHGTIAIQNLPRKGCMIIITLPAKFVMDEPDLPKSA
jgi:signal transduction histidine kinase